MFNTIPATRMHVQVMHIEDNSWKGVYIDGNLVTEGYFDVVEILTFINFMRKYAFFLAADIKEVTKSQAWFQELGGRLPANISFRLGE